MPSSRSCSAGHCCWAGRDTTGRICVSAIITADKVEPTVATGIPSHRHLAPSYEEDARASGTISMNRILSVVVASLILVSAVAYFRSGAAKVSMPSVPSEMPGSSVFRSGGSG